MGASFFQIERKSFLHLNQITLEFELYLQQAKGGDPLSSERKYLRFQIRCLSFDVEQPSGLSKHLYK